MLYGASTIRKKLRLDPHDLPQEKLLGSQAKSEISIELQGRNKFLHQQSEAEGTLHEGIIEGTSLEVPTFEVEEELVKVSTSQNMQSMKSSDLSHILDMGNDQCVLLQSQAMNILGSVNDNVSTDAIECNSVHEPIRNNIINTIIDHGKKRKELQHSQILFGHTSETVGFGPIDSLPREECLPLKRHASYHVKDCNMNKIESFASTSRTDVTNLACFSEETSFPWPSVTKSLRLL